MGLGAWGVELGPWGVEHGAWGGGWEPGSALTSPEPSPLPQGAERGSAGARARPPRPSTGRGPG